MNRILVVDFLNNLMGLCNVKERNPIPRYLKDLRNLIIETKANKVIFACDAGKSKFRTTRYAGYKQKRQDRRKEQPESEKKRVEEFFKECSVLQEIAPAFGIEVIKEWGIEADDISAYVANHTDLSETQILNVSSDQDWWGLLRKNIVQKPMYFGMKLGDEKLPQKIWLNRKRFEDFHKIEPWQWYHVKAFSEDSDNLQTPEGLGKKFALQLIQTYGSIQGVEKNIDNIKSDIKGFRQSALAELKSNFEQIYFNYDLVNLNYEENIKNEIFNIDLQEKLNYTIDNFDVKPKVDRESIEEFLLQRGEVNLLMKLDSWIQPFEGKFE